MQEVRTGIGSSLWCRAGHPAALVGPDTYGRENDRILEDANLAHPSVEPRVEDKFLDLAWVFSSGI